MIKKSSVVVACVTTMLFACNAYADVVFDSTTAGTFMDISLTGTALGLTDDGETDFLSTFLGTNVRIGNNGGLAVEAAGGNSNLFAGNQALPNATAFSAVEVFLPFWDDLDTELGDVFVQDFGDRLIVQWENRPHFSGVGATDGVTFQAQIFGREATTAAGGIIAQYLYTDTTFAEQPQNDNGASATIGYQSTATDAAQFSFNTESVFDGDVLTLRTTPVPEPGSLIILGVAGIGMMMRRRSR